MSARKLPAKTTEAAQTSNAIEPRYVNAQQAAAAYGVSPETLRSAVQAGKLRAKRTGPEGGGKHLFKIAWLDAWADGLIDA